nr:immunoglobulin light chain junction region [Macaca mulatta]MOX57959.1 immunoglobulin light chain junction region [Macaca mulatta]
SMQNTHFPPTF